MMRHTRSMFFATVLLSLTALPLAAQVKPLKEDLLKLLDLLPPPCASMDEARAQCADPSGGNGCSTDKLMASFTQAYQEKNTARAAAGGGMNASQEELMRKMQDPAFQEQMKKMTPDQLMALSAQLQGGGLPMSGIPTPEETAMAEEFERINDGLMDFALKYTTEWAQLRSVLEEKKRAIEQARWAEVEKCPKETSGEVTFTSPACCAEKEKKYDAQWHAAVVEWLPKANDVVKRYRTAIRERFAEAGKRMAALGYGDKCGVQMFYDMITSTQGMILGSAEAAAQMAGDVWDVACENKVGMDNAMICP